MLDENKSLIQLLQDRGDKAVAEFIDSLTEKQAADLQYDWRAWGRPNQFAPGGDWTTWLILAGRGYGKTRAGSEWIREKVCGHTPMTGGQHPRIALVAETAADARDVLVEGDSGILSVHPKDQRPLYEPSKRRLTWPNGAIAHLYNATEPDQLRGPQHSLAWCDELAKYDKAQDVWDMLQFGLRLGKHPQQIVTTTPKPIPLIKRMVKEALDSADMPNPPIVVTRGSTFDNAGNLAPSFLKQIEKRYSGTRLGRQELEAAILDDLPGALWTQDNIDANRINCTPGMDWRAVVPTMQRIVVAIDPSGTGGSDDEGDSIGIVAAGWGVDDLFYVLADRTCKLSPDGWGRRAVQTYKEFEADRIVAERNFGGAMVEHVIRSIDRNVSYSEVVASRGKVIRAEPIAALYEQNRVKHVGTFDALEDQLCNTASDGYAGEGSPDRMDALVWAITELTTGSQYNVLNWMT